jgi:WD40 repeat protein
MLPTPSTPPSYDAAEMVDANSGAALSMGWGYPSPSSSTSPLSPVVQASHSYALASPPGSSSSVAGEALHQNLDLESPHLSDEDQDMSEGGALLSVDLAHEDLLSTPLPGHAQELSAELDMLDAAVMGEGNLDELFFGDAHQATTWEPPSSFMAAIQAPALPLHSSDDIDDHMLYDEFEPAEAANLPTAMLEVSQQLEHLQDAHENVDILGITEAQHDVVADHSISPPLLPTLSSASFESPEVPSQEDVASSMEASSLNSQAAGLALGLPDVLHPGGHGGFAAAAAADASTPDQSHQITVSHLNNLDASWDDIVSEADQPEVDDQFNMSLGDFLYRWGRSTPRESGFSDKTSRSPSLPAVLWQRSLRDLDPVVKSDLQGDKCDIQRIDWKELGVSRLEAKKMRKRTYKNYTNLRLPAQWHVSTFSDAVDPNMLTEHVQPQLRACRIPNGENYFSFRQMSFNHDVHLSHFQLRNLMACASRDHIFYAGISKVMHYTPTSRSNPRGVTSMAMDLTNPMVQPYHAFSSGVQISTLTIGHDVLVAGGFCGEYGIVNLRASRESTHAEGLISDHPNSITNHVQVHLSRSSSLPLAAFSSNDNGVRLLDINTNRFVAEHKYDHAINCSAISPDQRLRVLVGDAQNVMICNADTGEVLHELDGHRDFGFACDWADDGWTVATGNQDMQVKIWDARKWTNSRGVACPVTTIAAEMAGVRKLKFSPCGSGKRLLVAAEPADFVSVINAETFASKQTLSFFGEIGGVDFTNDGQDLFVGNCDWMRGGIMEFERCDFASSSLSGPDERGERRGDWYDWDAEDEGVGRRSRGRGTAEQQRRPARLGTTMAPF